MPSVGMKQPGPDTYMFICRSASEYQVQYSRPGPDAGEQVSLVCTAWPACAIGAIGARAGWFNGCITLLLALPLQPTSSATTTGC